MGYIDIHSHILPGVDDGSRSMEQSLEILKKASENGISKIILTPHNKAEHRNVSVEGIHRRLDELQKAALDREIPVTLYPGTEIFYRDGVVEMLEEGELCTLAGSRYVLVEFLPLEQFAYIRAAIYELVSGGFVPVLAHVERYACMASSMDNVRHAIDRGALIQINASTVTGGMGLKGKQIVKKMLKEHLVHFVATDTHDEGRRGPNMKDCAQYLSKKFGDDYAAEILHDNAQLVIRGEMI